MLASSLASSKPVGPVLVAGSQHAGIWETANEPADGCLVVGDPLDVWDLLVGRQDPDRDRVLVDVQPQVDGHTTRDTGHGRLPLYVGSVRAIVDDPRTCYLRNGAGRSMTTGTDTRDQPPQGAGGQRTRC
jgi:hypothetical protein